MTIEKIDSLPQSFFDGQRDVNRGSFALTLVSLLKATSGMGSAGANAWKANNVAGPSEGYVFYFDVLKLMPGYGVQLYKDTIEKLVLSVRDDTTGVDAFNCIAYGFDIEH